MEISKLIDLLNLLNLGNSEQKPTVSDMYQAYVGKAVLIRDRNEGINLGVVAEIDATGVRLKDAQRLHHFVSKDKSLSWYEGVALSGLDAEKSRISPMVEEKLIISPNFSATLVSDEALKQMRGLAVYVTIS